MLEIDARIADLRAQKQRFEERLASPELQVEKDLESLAAAGANADLAMFDSEIEKLEREKKELDAS